MAFFVTDARVETRRCFKFLFFFVSLINFFGSGSLQNSDRNLDSCCCGRAIYRIAFHGMWDPPKVTKYQDRSNIRTGWQALIGASHSQPFKMFQTGKTAPPHLIKELSQDSISATFLENFIRSNQENVRTVIRMPDLWSGMGTSSAQLSVTPSYHFISFFAYMFPTTDWFAGLDSLSLCNTRCMWTKSMDINLEMFDAGTHEPTWDNPSVFDRSSRQREIGSTVSVLSTQVLSKLGASYQNDYEWIKFPNSKLVLQRTGVFGNDTCRLNNEADSPPFGTKECAVTSWTEWSDCNCEQMSCPAQYRFRTRKLVDPECCDNLPSQACAKAVGHTTERQKCEFVERRN